MKAPAVGFPQTAQYGVWITDRCGGRNYHALRSSLDSAHVRLEGMLAKVRAL